MACHSHCNQCALHPGYIGPATPAVWSDDPVDTNDPVYDDHFNELRSEIKDELTRRSTAENTAYPDPGVVDTNDTVYNEHYRYLRNQIYVMGGYVYPWVNDDIKNETISAGQPILADTTNDLRDTTDVLMSECICNCNYSCTCNCNYCVCQCNYTCQCNCNYSDKRLKRDIVYL